MSLCQASLALLARRAMISRRRAEDVTTAATSLASSRVAAVAVRCAAAAPPSLETLMRHPASLGGRGTATSMIAPCASGGCGQHRGIVSMASPTAVIVVRASSVLLLSL